MDKKEFWILYYQFIKNKIRIIINVNIIIIITTVVIIIIIIGVMSEEGFPKKCAMLKQFLKCVD